MDMSLRFVVLLALAVGLVVVSAAPERKHVERKRQVKLLEAQEDSAEDIEDEVEADVASQGKKGKDRLSKVRGYIKKLRKLREHIEMLDDVQKAKLTATLEAVKNINALKENLHGKIKATLVNNSTGEDEAGKEPDPLDEVKKLVKLADDYKKSFISMTNEHALALCNALSEFETLWHNEVTPEQKALLKMLKSQQTSTIKPDGNNTGTTLTYPSDVSICKLPEQMAGNKSTDLAPLLNFENKVYYINTDQKLNWFASMRFCHQHNMRLLSILTEEENTFIASHLLTYSGAVLHNDTKPRQYWTSGLKLGTNEYFWMEDGEVLDFTDWYSGEFLILEPESESAAAKLNLCLLLRNHAGRYKWSNDDCLKEANFVCMMK